MSGAAAAISVPVLLRQMGAAFGLSQVALGRLLGLSGPMMRQISGGHRPLPATAYVPFARLVLALNQLPAAPTGAPGAAPPPPPDPAALRARQLECLAGAQNAALALRQLRARAAWATRRLAAVPTLRTALGLPTAEPDPAAAAADPAAPAPTPRWLEAFEAEAHAALAAASPTAQARLLLRQDALLHEAAQAARLLAGSLPLADFAETIAAAIFATTTTPLSYHLPLMAFSANRFTTRAQCADYLTRKATARILLVANQTAIAARLATWDAGGDPTAALAATEASLASMRPMVAAMAEGADKRRIENMILTLEKKSNAYEGRAESHGPDDLLDLEQDRDDAANALLVHDALVAAVQARHDALPA